MKFNLKDMDYMMKKHPIENASPFATKQLGDKLRKVLDQQKNQQKKKTNWYLELVIAGLIGASLTLAFVVIHQMLTTEWTW
tara:strand:+ start:1374 stop:1616 length:243 start_codon:yes stop_codon:yes gene_type:complete